MRTIRLFLAMVLLLPVVASNAQSSKEATPVVKPGKVEAYYFHFNARCVTCRTVEAETKADIESLYPDLIKSGKVIFQAVNLDEPSGKTIADKLGVNGQTLLLVSGEEKINITNEGFMYARSNPDKLKAIIKEKIDKLLL
jgi:hypothetical protein